MSLVSVNGGLYFPLRNSQVLHATTFYGGSSYAISANGNKIALIGRLFMDGRAANKTFGGGSSALLFTTSQLHVFTNAGSSLDIGIQDVAASAANNQGAIPDGTFDVKKNYAGNTGPTAAGTAYNLSFASTVGGNTKTLSHGDLIAVVFELVNRAGSDVIDIVSTAYSSNNISGFANYVSSTWAEFLVAPNVGLIMSDGTLAWIDSGFPLYSNADVLAYTYASSDNPNEYGMLFQVPWSCKIDALFNSFRQVYNAASETLPTFDLVLYGDPLGTPTALATVSMDSEKMTGTQYTYLLGVVPLTSEITLSANTPYAVVQKATNAANTCMGYETAPSEAFKTACLPNGSTIKKVTRGGGSGAFTAQNPAVDIPTLGVRISAFDNGAGASGVKVHPGMNGGLNG